MIPARPLLIFALTIAYAFNSMACYQKQRRPDRHLIPEGYVGWVRINYDVYNAPAIPSEEGYNLFKIPPEGLLNTSSSVEEGWAKDEYYYYTKDSRRLLPHTVDNEMIWGNSIGSKTIPGQKPTTYEEFFVGTKEEFEKYGVKRRDAEGTPIIGPIREVPYRGAF
jgi:hypothetical protein